MLSHIFTLLTTVLPPVDDKYDYKTSGPISADMPTSDIFNSVSNWLIAGIGMVAVIFLIIGAIQYASAMGDSDKMDTAKRTMKWSVLGMIIALLSYMIIPLIVKMF